MAAKAPKNEIKLRQAENVAQAIGYADQIGCTLNRFVTISWTLAGCVGPVKDSQGCYLAGYRHWAKYWKFTPAYVWVIESGPIKGLHSHILIHVPDELIEAFQKISKSWIKGKLDQSGSSKTYVNKPQRYGKCPDRLKQVKGTIKYMLKAVNKPSGKLIGVDPVPTKAGYVAGKRLGTSRNLGQDARRKHAENKQQAKGKVQSLAGRGG
ncbi:MAG: hypothetical protein HON14_17440 [Rhodospirillaceae bacterium]|mgnify:CR=1 FL=1|jgi:hypothetical protein|nr:hypothetical protein [Rhodospirillaceae bacterium]MBT4940927.1 hypothetical protein [Rhodospirillaceae bacterium]